MKKEILYNFIFTLLTSIIIFIQNKYFVQYMGIENLGIMKLFTQLLQYLNIVELGLGSASSFALYKPLAEKNQEQISIIISTIKKIYNKISIILLLLGMLVAPFLPYFIKLNNFSKNIYLWWILYVISTVSTYLYIKYIILFTANQEFIYVRFIQSMSKIFYQMLQIVFIIKFQSFYIFIFLLLLDNLTQYIFFKIHYDKNYSYIYKTKEKYLGLNRDIKNLFWHKIGGLVVFNTDLILISKFVSIEVVGMYSSYQIIIQMISTIVGVILNVLRPKIGKFISLNTKEIIYILFKRINTIFLMFGMYFSWCTYILINSFVSIWIGKEYIFNSFIIKLIMINLFVIVFRGIIDIFKDSSGFFDDIQSPILEAIINLIFSIILGLKIGLAGIIMGTIISNMSIILIYKPVLVFKRCFDKDWLEYGKVYGNYLFLIVLSLFVLNLIIRPFIVLEINGWIEWIIYAVKISSISGIVIFFIFLINKEFRNILREYILKKQ